MEKFEAALRRVRKRAPLVQCITNFVTVNDCANILLASGASPTMAHDIREAAEAVTGADALVCNMGAIEDTDAMILAGKQANRLGKPVILRSGSRRRDCASPGIRRTLLSESIRRHPRKCLGDSRPCRRNGSRQRRGCRCLRCRYRRKSSVVSGMVRSFSQRTGSVIAVSGAIDIISDGNNAMALRGGCAPWRVSRAAAVC